MYNRIGENKLLPIDMPQLDIQDISVNTKFINCRKSNN